MHPNWKDMNPLPSMVRARDAKLRVRNPNEVLSKQTDPTIIIVAIIGTGYSLKDKNKAKPDKTETGIG
ncbi:hypothetical protein Tco_1068595 [Tanacetum coccineum]|uniref:Uncharacterized protein n=1 Tax=Tanacetum coccineum TaxID=301880 RepID=A0ABQ5HG47_9ASTR